MDDSRPSYTIRTIGDIFNIVTAENVDRLTADLAVLFNTFAKLKAQDPNIHMQKDHITWRDDGAVRTDVNIFWCGESRCTYPNCVVCVENEKRHDEFMRLYFTAE